jgi:hypothetical protein
VLLFNTKRVYTRQFGRVIIIIIIIIIIIKEAEKKLKYKNLSRPIEIQRMWNMKCFVTPVIIGATGIVSKSLQKMSVNNTRTTLNRFFT